jgi:hypothetical protein
MNRLLLARGGLPCALGSVSPSPPFVCGFGVPLLSDNCLFGEFGSLGGSLFTATDLVRNVPERFRVALAEHRRIFRR